MAGPTGMAGLSAGEPEPGVWVRSRSRLSSHRDGGGRTAGTPVIDAGWGPESVAESVGWPVLGGEQLLRGERCGAGIVAVRVGQRLVAPVLDIGFGVDPVAL